MDIYNEWMYNLVIQLNMILINDEVAPLFMRDMCVLAIIDHYECHNRKHTHDSRLGIFDV